jgi:hypothetical protein
MGFKQAFFAASLLATLTSAQSPLWGQCGGNGWTGPTTCASGSTCTFSNPWYSQCLPGAAPPSSTTTTTTRRITTTTTRVVTTPSPTTTLIQTTSSSTTTTLVQTTSSSTTSASPIASPSTSRWTLWATHYSGTISTLTFTESNGAYSLTSSSQTACGSQPSWLTFDAASGTLYCLDEYWAAGALYTYRVGTGGLLSQTARINTIANGLHSTFYGGSNGKGYLAVAH